MTGEWIYSKRWLAIKFVALVCIALAFHAVVYRSLRSQMDQMEKRGFDSARMEVLSRFEPEFQRIHDLGSLYVAGQDNVQTADVQLALDIFWSRVVAGLGDEYYRTYGDQKIDISIIYDLQQSLPLFEAAVHQLKPGDPASLDELTRLWRHYRDGVTAFSEAAYVARVRRLTDASSDQWALFEKLHWYQIATTAYGALFLLVFLVELYWSRRIVGRLEASSTKNHELANTDPLTNLANRRAFDAELARRSVADRRIAGLWIEIDRFKAVNDAFGHAVGDKILGAVASRLSALGPNLFVARIAGDAFFILLDRGASHCLAMAERLCMEMRNPIIIDGKRYDASVSIGVAVVKQPDNDSPERLLQMASLALMAAKKEGGPPAVLFTEELQKQNEVHAVVEEDLATAIDSSQLEIAVQPKTSLPDGDICGFEALVRWCHPTLGPINPELLCQIADEIGLSSRLGLMVADRAFELTAALKRGGFGARMSINISPAFGGHPTFVRDVNAILDRHDLTPHDIELEVTEESLMSDIGPIRDNMREFKRLGAHIAIDDFGKGHSNISRLLHLSVSDIKIDKSMTDGIVLDYRARAIISSVVDLASTLGMEAIVEGVETQEQADILTQLGVKQIQGYLISPPLHPLKLVAWLEQRALQADACMEARPKPSRRKRSAAPDQVAAAAGSDVVPIRRAS